MQQPLNLQDAIFNLQKYLRAISYADPRITRPPLDGIFDSATEESVLAGFVSCRESADALLGRLKGAYETPPLVMVQIAAVTQWVMLPDPCFLFFWKACPSDGRAVWKAALEARMAGTSDVYVRAFCRQQLELCR